MNWLFLAVGPDSLTPENLWSAWNLEPAILIPLLLTVLIYAWGTRNAWRRAEIGHGITWWQCASLLGAIIALSVALVSPLDALSESLFSAHMVQHLILTLVAAPHLVLSDFPVALMWALPRHSAQGLSKRLNRSHALSRAWHIVVHPIFAWVLFTLALWGWHSQALYEAALRDEIVHAFEHLVFLGTALLYWWVLFRHSEPNHKHFGMAVIYLFTTILQSGVLGALMSFSLRPWYPYYQGLVEPWGLTALQDQQLAGLIMWVPAGTVLTILTIGYFGAWFRAIERRSERMQRQD